MADDLPGRPAEGAEEVVRDFERRLDESAHSEDLVTAIEAVRGALSSAEGHEFDQEELAAIKEALGLLEHAERLYMANHALSTLNHRRGEE